MAKRIVFHKLHGLGNDFVLIDARPKPVKLSLSQVREIGSRTRGVGFDQLLLLKKKAGFDCEMVIYNTDGSKAEMCGNGLRAAALYLWSRGGKASKALRVLTAAGERSARMVRPVRKGALQGEIECTMGIPNRLPLPQALAGGFEIAGQAGQAPERIEVGNPHVVLFLSPGTGWLDAEVVTKWGSFFEKHPSLPEGTNVEFVVVASRRKIRVQVWERGVGITEACGTGAVAAMAACRLRGLVDDRVQLEFPGGKAHVAWDAKPGTPASLTGSAHYSFEGILP